MNHNAVIKQIDDVLAVYEQKRKRSQQDDLSDLPDTEWMEIITLVHAAITRLSPPRSQYQQHASTITGHHGLAHASNVQPLLGVLKALRADYEAGRMKAVHELIHADVFADFLEMADYLLSEGYKDPAAVIAGSVLEGHLHQLSEKHGIPVLHEGRPRRAEALNAELCTKEVYRLSEQKSVTAWLDLRNKGAHEDRAYAEEQVGLLIQSVRDFISRHPA